jgi:AraC family transcriptional regulator, exoenzyme S synthesis regulatory protein ExsA
MYNVIEALRSPAIAELLPGIRKFEIGELLFAYFTCPPTPTWEASWAEHDRLVHVAIGNKTLRTATGTWEVGPGDTVFLKKGACFLKHSDDTELCVFMYFIPDDFVRAAVRELKADLPALPPPADTRDMVIRVKDDAGVQAFLQSMTVFFNTSGAPPKLLLKLKLRELIASIIVSSANASLSSYLRMLARSDAPSIPAIMEQNCCHNLPLAAFARLCHRSLSTFKRDFHRHYGMAPGRWLLDRRLECSERLLKTTNMSVTDVVFECGFEQPSHFSRAFKAKYGRTPSEYRDAWSQPRGQARRTDNTLVR